MISVKKTENELAHRGGEILIYQTEIGETRLDVRLEDETVWLTQKAMAELFQTTPQNITLHLNNIYVEGELAIEATCKDFLQVKLRPAEGGTITTRVTDGSWGNPLS